MKYTYRISQQGGGDLFYLCMTSARTSSQSSQCLSYWSKNKPEILFAINEIKVVVKCDLEGNSGGLIYANGDELTVKIHCQDAKKVVPIVQAIVKRVQRRYAKGEPRKRVRLQEIQCYIKNLNKRTY